MLPGILVQTNKINVAGVFQSKEDHTICLLGNWSSSISSVKSRHVAEMQEV